MFSNVSARKSCSLVAAEASTSGLLDYSQRATSIASFLTLLATLILGVIPAHAQVPACPQTVNAGDAPVGTCSSPEEFIDWQSGNLTISPSANVNTGYIAVQGATTGTLTNNGNVQGAAAGFVIGEGSVQAIVNNSGSVISGGPFGGILGLFGTINNIENYGTITSSGSADITTYYLDNPADLTIGSLINAQGARSSVVGDAPLRYDGRLPTMYQIVVNNTEYGKVVFTRPGESTTSFGVANTSTLPATKTRYATVIASDPGSLDGKITNTSGTTSTGRAWRLIDNGDGTYDLEIDGVVVGRVGPNVLNTYQALTSNRDALLGALHERYAVLNTVSQYDCNRFDKYGVCLSFQARATGWGSQTTGAGVFNIAYRVHPNIRAGVYLDYQVAQATPFGTNFGTGGIQYGYNNPTFGGYVGFSQSGYNGTPVNEGVQAFMSGGYNPGKITVTRAILDGTEPGQGTAGLNAYYAYGTLGYGVKIADKTTVVPYAGLLYTNVIRNAYQEQLNPIVQSPLGYNAFYEQLLTGVVGGRVQSMITDKLGANVGAGAQFDLSRNANSYSGYSYIEGMEAFGIEHGGSWNGARPTGQAGVFYNVTKNEQLLLNAYVGQQAYTTRTYTSLLAGYQLSF